MTEPSEATNNSQQRYLIIQSNLGLCNRLMALKGGDHAVQILSEDLKNNMIQLGCRRLDELGSRLS